MVSVIEKRKTKQTRKPAIMLQRDEQSDNGIPDLTDEVAEQLVQFFKLFSDETRLRIMHYLMQNQELNVRTLCELLGQSQPAVSHHLALLRVAGLIESRRDGKHNYYHILPAQLQELMGMLFSVAPGGAGRIGFETFTLSFTPVKDEK